MSTDILQSLITRIAAQHPDLWEVFRADPEAAIEAAGIELTPEEKEAIHTAVQKLTRGLKPADDTRSRKLAESFKADLDAARLAQELARRRLLEGVQGEETPQEVPDLLAEERRWLRAEEEKMRAALAEERRRMEEERRRAERLLGRRRSRPDKEGSR